MAQDNENNECYVQFPITKCELVALSIYFMDKDNDIEGYGIDAVVDRIHSRANGYEKELYGRRI